MNSLFRSIGLALAIIALGLMVLLVDVIKQGYGFRLSLGLLVVTVVGLQTMMWRARARGQAELFGHPLPLYMLFLSEMWERFSYYGMRAIFMLYMTNYLMLESGFKAGIYGDYTGLVWLTPLIGGFIADRFAGLQKTILIGGTMMAIGQFCLALHAWGGPETGAAAAQSLAMMFTGLLLLIVGNGMFKPNISTIVGKLYAADDPRRDSAFTLFYMGINVGAFFSPIICGYLAQTIDWRYGFLAAGAGMVLGTLTFFFGKRMLGAIGMEPDGARRAAAGATAAVPLRSLGAGEKFTRGVMYLGMLAAVSIGLYLAKSAADEQSNILAIVDPLLWSLAVAACLALFNYLQPRCNKQEFSRITAIYVLGAFVMAFWATYEQAGSSLTLFADKNTDCSLFSKPFPSSWFQSVPAIFVIAFAPIFSELWTLLAARRKEPSTAFKMVMGIGLNAASFAIMIPAAIVAMGGNRVGPQWLTVLYALQTFGELCLSPVGLSMVTKLAPARYAAMMMGIWFFIANAFGNKIAGSAAAVMEKRGSTELFEICAVALVLMAGILWGLVPWLRRQMSGIH